VGVLEALGRILVLRRADGYAGDVRAIVPRCVNRERSPATSDLQHAVARPNAQLAAGLLEFFQLGDFERVLSASEVCARIEHLGIEEQSVELVSQIVVGLNVAAAAGNGVGA